MTDRILELDLPCDASSPQRARHEAAKALGDHGGLHELDDVLVVISELVTNAVRHTGSRCVLAIRQLAGPELSVEVNDSDSRPETRPVRRELGRGLGIVQVLADRWGIEWLPGGKCVWAELHVDPHAE